MTVTRRPLYVAASLIRGRWRDRTGIQTDRRRRMHRPGSLTRTGTTGTRMTRLRAWPQNWLTRPDRAAVDRLTGNRTSRRRPARHGRTSYGLAGRRLGLSLLLLQPGNQVRPGWNHRPSDRLAGEHSGTACPGLLRLHGTRRRRDRLARCRRARRRHRRFRASGQERSRRIGLLLDRWSRGLSGRQRLPRSRQNLARPWCGNGFRRYGNSPWWRSGCRRRCRGWRGRCLLWRCRWRRQWAGQGWPQRY